MSFSPNILPVFKGQRPNAVIKGGKTGLVVKLVNNTARDVWLTSTISKDGEISLQDTIFSSVKNSASKLSPSDTAEVSLCDGKHTAVYVWLAPGVNVYPDDNAYPDAAGLFDDDGDLVKSLYTAAVLRIQKTNVPGTYYLTQPHVIKVKNDGPYSLWYETQSTTDNSVALNQGHYGGGAIELQANTEHEISLLLDTYRSKVFFWGAVNQKAPASGSQSNLALLVSNTDGKILQKESDGVIEFKDPTKSQWFVKQVNNAGMTSETGIAGWVWAAIAIAVAVILILAFIAGWARCRKPAAVADCGGLAKEAACARPPKDC